MKVVHRVWICNLCKGDAKHCTCTVSLRGSNYRDEVIEVLLPPRIHLLAQMGGGYELTVHCWSESEAEIKSLYDEMRKTAYQCGPMGLYMVSVPHVGEFKAADKRAKDFAASVGEKDGGVAEWVRDGILSGELKTDDDMNASYRKTLEFRERYEIERLQRLDAANKAESP